MVEHELYMFIPTKEKEILASQPVFVSVKGEHTHTHTDNDNLAGRQQRQPFLDRFILVHVSTAGIIFIFTNSNADLRAG